MIGHKRNMDIVSQTQDPLKELIVWLQQAEKDGEVEPTAMNLATVDSNGRPNSRTVLFKGIYNGAIQLFTNYESPKSRELIENPYATLNFFWPKTYRQIRVRGSVRVAPREVSEAYFQTRARDSQLSAWASPQSAKVAHREFLESRKEKFKSQFLGQEVTCPDFWGGFLLDPESIEFWQGAGARFHKRVLFEKTDAAWDAAIQAP